MAHLYAGMARCLSPSFACTRLVETGTASPLRPGSMAQLTLPESRSSPQKQRCAIISCCTSKAKSLLWQESGSLTPARIVHSCRLFIPFHKELNIMIRRSSWRIAGSIWGNSYSPAPVTSFKYLRTHLLGQQVCLSKHSLVFCQEWNLVIVHLIQEGLLTPAAGWHSSYTFTIPTRREYTGRALSCL